MSLRIWSWILVPLALSAGVLWLSAQESKTQPEAVKISELANQLQEKERQLVQKERQLQELEQRLNTLQAALDRDRVELMNREKTFQETKAKFDEEHARPTLDPQLVRTYEGMDPTQGARALKELATINQDVAVSLMAGMQPKKAAKLMDQLAGLDARLAGKLSERVGVTKKAAEIKP